MFFISSSIGNLCVKLLNFFFAYIVELQEYEIR